MPYASPQPRRINPPVCPLPRSLATTSGISVDFSSSPYLDVSVQAVPYLRLFYSTQVDRVLLCRVSPFGNSGIKAYVQLPQTYRSLSRPSSALDAKAFPLRSYQLDRNADLCRSATGSHQELCRLQIRFIVVLCYPLKSPQKFTLLPLCCLLAISCLHSLFSFQGTDVVEAKSIPFGTSSRIFLTSFPCFSSSSRTRLRWASLG